jgi:hypothetical protein
VISASLFCCGVANMPETEGVEVRWLVACSISMARLLRLSRISRTSRPYPLLVHTLGLPLLLVLLLLLLQPLLLLPISVDILPQLGVLHGLVLVLLLMLWSAAGVAEEEGDVDIKIVSRGVTESYFLIYGWECMRWLEFSA